MLLLMGGSPVRSSDPPRPDRAPPDGALDRLDTIEADLAALTAHALALVGDAVTAQQRLRSDVARVVMLGALGTVTITAALCAGVLVILC